MSRVFQLAKQYPPYKGGVELVSQMISRAHCDNNDSVTVVSFGEGSKEYRGDYGEMVVQVNRDLFIKSAPLSFKLWRRFKKMVMEEEIDQIYVHLPNPYMHQLVHYYGKLLKRKGIRVIAVYHSDLVNQRFLAPFYNKLFLHTSHVYDRIIVSSGKLWDSSAVLRRLDDDKRWIIPFCVNSEVEYQKRTQFTGKLLSIGRFVPYKGFDFLVDALNHTDYKLTIVGDGPMRRQLEKKAGSNITFAGLISDEKKRKLLSECDLLIMSSVNRAEAYGMVIVEAFKAGIPVVAANINSGVTYLVEDETRGKIFEIRHKEQLLRSLEAFKSNPDLLAHCSANARKFYDENLDYTIFKKKLLECK